ncbi:MAG: V-type ATP synthase subunit B, partial [Brevinema sp.]
MDLKIIKSYQGLQSVNGSLVFVKTIPGVSYGEITELTFEDSSTSLASVIEITEEYTALQLYGLSNGINLKTTSVKFSQQTLQLGVSTDMMGRIFNALGQPIDGMHMPKKEFSRDINGFALNPIKREYPHDFIQTGISAIDTMNTVVRGQKLPIFSGAGLPHNQLAAQITAQATSKSGNQFVVVFAAMGMRHDDATYFIESFRETGALNNSVLFMNYADDPAIERLVTPRMALTLAEYLAFDKEMDVLVILSDMTSYAEALREISAARGELPSRKGFPGYMYSDL